MKKKLLSVLLTAVITAGTLAGCGGASSGGSGEAASGGSAEAAKDGEYTQITYAFVSFNTIPDNTADVEEIINQVSREKIGVEVHLMPLSIADYSQQVSLAAQNGEIDIFHTLGDLSQDISSDMVLDITDMIDDLIS